MSNVRIWDGSKWKIVATNDWNNLVNRPFDLSPDGTIVIPSGSVVDFGSSSDRWGVIRSEKLSLSHPSSSIGKIVLDSGADVANELRSRGWLILDDGSNVLAVDSNEIASSSSLYVESKDDVVFVTNGSVRPDTDASVDFGTSDVRWRDGYFSGDVHINGSIELGGSVYISSLPDWTGQV